MEKEILETFCWHLILYLWLFTAYSSVSQTVLSKHTNFFPALADTLVDDLFDVISCYFPIDFTPVRYLLGSMYIIFQVSYFCFSPQMTPQQFLGSPWWPVLDTVWQVLQSLPRLVYVWSLQDTHQICVAELSSTVTGKNIFRCSISKIGLNVSCGIGCTSVWTCGHGAFPPPTVDRHWKRGEG